MVVGGSQQGFLLTTSNHHLNMVISIIQISMVSVRNRNGGCIQFQDAYELVSIVVVKLNTKEYVLDHTESTARSVRKQTNSNAVRRR
ncbi:unnamed protein product [Schistosoma margrebowiei]|uniref:Uncharacterized protein n=1 Tax=Schistosoma margrebowiei TaxID=48269 RepID=A0A183M9Q4_9TREM|nr:unnamed protein product [Schistosoma margrebowiei]